MDDDADFAVRLQNEVTGPAREITREIRKVKDAFQGLDDAMAHQKWVKDQRKLIADKRQADILRAAEIKKARMGGFDIEDVAAGAAKAGVLAVAAAATAAAVAVGYLAVSFASATEQAAEFGQASRMALTQLIGDEATAAREFDAVRSEAQQLGLDVEDTVKSFQKLVAAQFTIGESKEIIRLGADLQAIGSSAEEVQRAILAITQIKSKGRVQAEELLQLQEAGLSQGRVVDALMEQTGKNREEVLKALQTGEISADQGIAAIMSAVKHKVGEKELGEAGRAFADSTIKGMRKRLLGRWQNLLIDAGTAIEPVLTKIATKVVGLFEKILDNPAVQALGQRLLSQFELFGIWVDANWPQIEATIIGGVELIAGAIQVMNDVLDWAIINWDIIGATLEGVGVVLGLLATSAFLLMLPFVLATAAILAAVGAVAYAIGWVYEHGTELIQAFVWLGKQVAQGLIDGVMSMVSVAVNAVLGLGNAVIQAFKKVLGIASPSTVMAEFGSFTVAGFTDEISANDNTVRGATAGMATQALSGFDAGMGDGPGAAGGGSGAGSPITINVYQQPGESSQELAARIRAELEKMLEEDAA